MAGTKIGKPQEVFALLRTKPIEEVARIYDIKPHYLKAKIVQWNRRQYLPVPQHVKEIITNPYTEKKIRLMFILTNMGGRIWLSGNLYEYLKLKGYKTQYRTFQRDIDTLRKKGKIRKRIIPRERKGRSSLIWKF